MTPTDIMPSRVPTAAETGAVRSTSGKSGNDGKGEGDAGFRDLLKQIAGDKGEQKAAETAARGKEASAHGRARSLDSAKAALAELRNRQGKERVRDGADKDVEADAAGTADAAEGTAADETETDTGTSTNAVAMLLSLAHKGETTSRGAASGGQGGAASPDPTLGEDAAATALAEKSLREVKVTSVKVETHFAAVRTDAATTGFAQRLALSQMSSSGTPQGNGLDAKGKTDEKLGLEATAVSGTEKSGDARPTRGQMFAARGDHRGADTAGGGTGKSGSDGKPAMATVGAAPVERASTANVDATQGAQAATPLQQLSNRLLATAYELQKAASATPASTAGTEASTASAPPVRVLSINLHPEELGSVTVRMSMVAGSLDVQIDAEMPDTAQMLRTDSDQITDLLRSAGIQVDGVTVRAASPDFVSTSGGSTGSFFDQQPQSQSGGASSDGRGFGSQRRGDDPSQSFPGASNFGQDDESRNQRGRGTGLYV